MPLRVSVPLAIIIGAVLVCATLVVVNVRTSYPRRGMAPQVYNQLLASGCTAQYEPGAPGFAPVAVSVNCPLWVRL